MTHKEPVRSDLQVPKRRSGRGFDSRKGVGTTVTVLPEIREWLRNNTKAHWFFFTNKEDWGLWIAFHDRQDALLWKLTWH